MQIIIRSLVLFLFIWIVTRAMGRKELSQLSTFELILLVAVGDLIQQGVTGDDRSVVGAMLAVSVFALMTVAFSYTGFRWPRIAKVTEGVPVIIVKDGEPLPAALRVERLTVDEVKSAAREQGIQDLADVAVGVLEPDGKFSFLRDDGARPPRNPGQAAR
jgi:uncharacterized membrane protein YcaP (DUF421 family)